MTGLTSVPPGQVATIVTTLEMLSRAPARPMPDSVLRLARWSRPTTKAYRTLFARVGAPWLWYSRLAMDDAQLAAIIHDPGIEIFAATDRAGIEVGLLELDRRTPTDVEIGYLGLVPELTGQGHGRWLMAQAQAHAWRPGTRRLWVHTCTLDHPGALGFYRASGFVPVRRTIETFPDPRLAGLLPRDVAAHVPLIES